tara:strand:- start:1127 stop:1456 length:330 start_codon:yes stop_codon:yes gene_type:complete
MGQQNDFFLFGVIAIIPLIILSDGEKRKRALDMMSNSMWVTQFLLMIVFMLYVLLIHNPEDSEDKEQKLRMRKAVYQGSIAFIIAICAAFDLTVAPFWLVFLSSFFFTI